MKDASGKDILQRDIYWVNFDPSVGSEIQKKRPALVLQDHIVAGSSRTILVCPIISSTNMHPFDIALNEDFLQKNSRVRTIQVTSCDISRFLEYKGRIGEILFEKALNNINVLLGQD